ncbi:MULTISPECIES: hypothetical protein [Kitasatospora]|uniref:hypothetical protein n=1 Tax=Kitasatospora TaxID=2063 RepID=UPI000305D182
MLPGRNGRPPPRLPALPGPLIDAGRDLPHVPHRRDTAAWRALTALPRAGVTLHSGCRDGPGRRPRTPREVRERRAARPVPGHAPEPQERPGRR